MPLRSSGRDGDRLRSSFIVLHLVGPLFGLPICAGLLLFDSRPDLVVLAFTAGVCLFWLFPYLVRRRKQLDGSAFASVQLLAFVSLFGSFFYGGLNSPFTVWLLIAVLLAFLYVPKGVARCLACVALQAGLFHYFQQAYPPAPRVGEAALGILFLGSSFSAALYMSLIAAFYSRIKVEGSELAALSRRYEEASARSEALLGTLERDNRSTAQFIATASHELRTALNVAIGYSELLAEDAAAEERWVRQRSLERVIDSSRSMLALVADGARQAEAPAEAAKDGPTTGELDHGDGPRETLPAGRRPKFTASSWLPTRLLAFVPLLLVTGAAGALLVGSMPGPEWAGTTALLSLLALLPMLGWLAGRSARPRQVVAEGRDPLTGLLDRAAFQRALEDGLNSARGGEAALLFADLDGFKEVNDSLGHDVGDQLLAAVADRFSSILPPRALLARLGGDEFAAILFGKDAEADIRQLADAMLDAVTAPFATAEDHLTIGISIGLACGPADEISSKELLRRSDVAMYRAKHEKLGSIQSFQAQMDEALSFKRTMRQDLSQALNGDQLDLHLQPVVDARTGDLASAEALLRWTHPVLGPVSPAKLIALAEDSGQIIDIDDWVLERALGSIKRLGTLPVAVNISPVQFRHPGFARKIVDRLSAHSVPTHLLRLEITEGVLVTHTRAASRAIAELREAGIKIALDDFGTGFSSLGYLKDFGFDLLKVDRSFVQGLEGERRDVELLRAIVDLGHSLGMSVIAEGVETAGQAGLVQLLGCDYIQGYFTGRPLTVQAIEARMADTSVASMLRGTRRAQAWRAA